MGVHVHVRPACSGIAPRLPQRPSRSVATPSTSGSSQSSGFPGQGSSGGGGSQPGKQGSHGSVPPLPVGGAPWPSSGAAAWRQPGTGDKAQTSSSSSGALSGTSSSSGSGKSGGGGGGKDKAPHADGSGAPSTSDGSSGGAHADDHPPVLSPSRPQSSPATPTTNFAISGIHIAIFAAIFVGGALFAAVTLQFTADMEFSIALSTVVRRIAKSVAFRQLVVIGVAILLVRYCLNGALKWLAAATGSRVEWDKTKLYYILREVYQPLELLLLVAAFCTLGDTFVPSLASVPKATVSRVVRTIMSTSFILGFSSVVFNLKTRLCQENAWQAEMSGDVTQQRRWEAYDRLGTFCIYTLSFVLAIQAIGLEVTSVLAIGGIGGLAIGLAGREICENLLNGFLIMSTNPFEEGDEIHFFHSSKVVEGYVINIGWYRTQIRSFEREVYVIPNSVFSKNIVLNITRKNREYRFYESLLIRVQDVNKANSIIQDIRRIVRSEKRVINKLHRRVFLDKITRDECKIYMSFYLEAANRDAFMALKQDLILAFVDVVERNGAQLATPRTMIDMEKGLTEAIGNYNNPVAAGLAAAQAMAAAAASGYMAQQAGLGLAPPALAPPGGVGGGYGGNGGARQESPITTEATVLKPRPAAAEPGVAGFAGLGASAASSASAADAHEPAGNGSGDASAAAPAAPKTAAAAPAAPKAAGAAPRAEAASAADGGEPQAAPAPGGGGGSGKGALSLSSSSSDASSEQQPEGKRRKEKGGGTPVVPMSTSPVQVSPASKVPSPVPSSSASSSGAGGDGKGAAAAKPTPQAAATPSTKPPPSAAAAAAAPAAAPVPAAAAPAPVPAPAVKVVTAAKVVAPTAGGSGGHGGFAPSTPLPASFKEIPAPPSSVGAGTAEEQPRAVARPVTAELGAGGGGGAGDASAGSSSAAGGKK